MNKHVLQDSSCFVTCKTRAPLKVSVCLPVCVCVCVCVRLCVGLSVTMCHCLFIFLPSLAVFLSPLVCPSIRLSPSVSLFVYKSGLSQIGMLVYATACVFCVCVRSCARVCACVCVCLLPVCVSWRQRIRYATIRHWCMICWCLMFDMIRFYDPFAGNLVPQQSFSATALYTDLYRSACILLGNAFDKMVFIWGAVLIA